MNKTLLSLLLVCAPLTAVAKAQVVTIPSNKYMVLVDEQIIGYVQLDHLKKSNPPIEHYIVYDAGHNELGFVQIKTGSLISMEMTHNLDDTTGFMAIISYWCSENNISMMILK